MNYWSNIALCIWTAIHIFLIQQDLTFACNTYSDFCDNLKENAFYNIDRVNGKNNNKSSKQFNQYENIYNSTDNGLKRAIRSFKPYRSEKELSLEITTILDELLFESGYDSQIRPHLEGPPLEVAFSYHHTYAV